jgi:hypothetical protein
LPDFCQFSAKKNWSFSKKKYYDQIFLQKVSVVWAKKSNFFAKYFFENILKIIPWDPGDLLASILFLDPFLTDPRVAAVADRSVDDGHLGEAGGADPLHARVHHQVGITNHIRPCIKCTITCLTRVNLILRL